MAPQPTCQTCVRNYLGSKEDPALSENPNQLAEQVTNQVAKTDNTVPGPNKEVATRNQHSSMDIYQILANQTQMLQEIAQNLASIQQQLLLPQPKVNPDKSKNEAAEIQGTQSVEGTDTHKEKNKEFLNVMITGMKTPLRANNCPNLQNSINKSVSRENSMIKEGSCHKRKTLPSEVDMQDVPQCQTMQSCQNLPKSPTLKSKKIRHVPGFICFICHKIGHYMRHCPQKPYMDAPLQANMSTSRMPFYPQGSPNSPNVNAVRSTFPDDKRAKASCDMCQDIQEKKEMQEYKRRKVMSLEIQAKEDLCRKTNSPAQYYQKASQHSTSSGSTSRSTMSEPGQQATMINSNSHEGSNSVPCPTPSKRRGYKAGVECFICHEMGHYSWCCPQKVKSKRVQPTTSLPNVSGPKSSKSPNSGSASLTSPPVGQGRLNHVQVETNGKVGNLEQVEGAGEEQVPQARAEPQ
uniref:Retrotransposon protein, putative, unclassified n=1 Tax=Oryza sativa subsp. japonica TaxID=39947 RepID=Q2QZX8_ORYSJ|nr:retrotransposon protein, putative, unclassified [Oryza sativa Japonica Group]